MADDLDALLPAIEAELYARLGESPSENDRLAIRAALASAITRGYQHGAASLATRVRALVSEGELASLAVEAPNVQVEPDRSAEHRQPHDPPPSEQSGSRREQVTDIWGNPLGGRRRRRGG
jgi:hypothetical protein